MGPCLSEISKGEFVDFLNSGGGWLYKKMLVVTDGLFAHGMKF
jgi:hypothetical protein